MLPQDNETDKIAQKAKSVRDMIKVRVGGGLLEGFLSRTVFAVSKVKLKKIVALI